MSRTAPAPAPSPTVPLALGNPHVSFCSELGHRSTPTCTFLLSSWFSSPPTGAPKISKQPPSSQVSNTTSYTILLTAPGSGGSSAESAGSPLGAEVELGSFHGVSLGFPITEELNPVLLHVPAPPRDIFPISFLLLSQIPATFPCFPKLSLALARASSATCLALPLQQKTFLQLRLY